MNSKSKSVACYHQITAEKLQKPLQDIGEAMDVQELKKLINKIKIPVKN